MSGPVLVTGDFSANDALVALLTVEGLLFAAFSLAVTMLGPAPRPRRWLIPGPALIVLAVLTIGVVAAGAGAAWKQIFLEPGFPTDSAWRTIAIALACSVVAPPLLAVFIALGLREAS